MSLSTPKLLPAISNPSRHYCHPLPPPALVSPNWKIFPFLQEFHKLKLSSTKSIGPGSLEKVTVQQTSRRSLPNWVCAMSTGIVVLHSLCSKFYQLMGSPVLTCFHKLSLIYVLLMLVIYLCAVFRGEESTGTVGPER